jgi:hypothetical protein
VSHLSELLSSTRVALLHLSIMHLTRLLLGAKKLPAITSKRGNKNFYKGRGAPAAGEHTRTGGYKVDRARVATITFVAPDLTGFQVRRERERETSMKARERRELPLCSPNAISRSSLFSYPQLKPYVSPLTVQAAKDKAAAAAAVKSVTPP